MIYYYIYTALARERSKTLLAKEEAARRAGQARSHRQRAGTSDARKSTLRRIPNWLRPAGAAYSLTGRGPRERASR